MSALELIIKKELNERIEKAKDDFLKYIIEDSFEYVPYETGKLANSASIDEQGNIIYNEPYAKNVYNSDKKYYTNKNKHTTNHWLEVAYKDKSNKWQQKLKDLILK